EAVRAHLRPRGDQESLSPRQNRAGAARRADGAYRAGGAGYAGEICYALRSRRASSAISWIFCSVSTRLASAWAVRSAALRSRQVGFLLARAVFGRLNKPMIPAS